jgi:hypothetical protein
VPPVADRVRRLLSDARFRLGRQLLASLGQSHQVVTYHVVGKAAGERAQHACLRVDLLEECLNVRQQQISEGRHRCRTKELLAPKTACTGAPPSRPIVAISMMLPST